MSSSLGPIYTTVATFAKILNEPLRVENSKKGQTQGHTIRVPLAHANAYTLVERQLAHRLFRSDARARTKFAEEFVGQLVWKVWNTNTPLPNFAENKETVERIVDVLENRRVASLWRVLYPGSYVRMAALLSRATLDSASRPHDSLFHLMISLDAGHDVPPGYLDRFRPIFLEAFRMVEHKAFGATLAVARWLLSRFVYEMAEIRKEKQPRSTEDDPSLENEAEGTGIGTALDKSTKLELLREVFAGFGAFPTEAQDHYSDYSPLPAKTHSFENAVAEGKEVDIRDRSALASMLDGSEEAMRLEIERVRTKLLSSGNFKGTDQFPDFDVSIVDVPSSLRSGTVFPEASQLSSIFRRVLGRRAFQLSDVGTEVDIQALIARRTSNGDGPCFREERSGRGFKIRILVDRSTSMTGIRTAQAERAAKTLLQALTLPFVDLEIWGFQSPDDGLVTLSKFRGAHPNFEEVPVDGDTPLHIAIHYATNDLLPGTEAKHLVILTDGLPMCAGKNQKLVNRRTLIRLTGDEVRRARVNGVHVSALLIGEEDQDQDLVFGADTREVERMFGSDRFWSVVNQANVQRGLVDLVTRSFAGFLQTH